MVKNKNVFLSTTQIGITISSLLAGYLGEPSMTNLLSFLPIKESILELISFILVTYLSIVFSELLPKNIAIVYPYRTLKKVAIPIRIIHTVFYPLVFILDKSSNLLSKLLGIPVLGEDNEVFTQAELIRIARDSSKVSRSDLTSVDVILLERFLTLDDRRIAEVVTPINELNNSENYSYKFDKDLLGYTYKGKANNLVSISADVSIIHALEVMAELERPVLALKDKNDEFIGIVTDADCYREIFPKLVAAESRN